MHAAELTARTFGADRRVDDLRTDDFEELRSKLASRLGPTIFRNEIVKIRTVFNSAYDERMIDRPIWYGQSFDFPSKKVVRRAENAKNEDDKSNLFTSAEIKQIVKAADVQMKAMILLACNGGLGNMDVALLPLSAVNFEKGFIRFPRPKTELMRKVPLWPETIQAMKAALKVRREPKDPKDAGLFFITSQGHRWLQTKPGKKNKDRYVTVNTVRSNFSKLLKTLGINGRKRLGFYTLRHSFETIGGNSKDQVAVDFIMGHADPSMAAKYREGVPLDRLRAVVKTVHA